MTANPATDRRLAHDPERAITEVAGVPVTYQAGPPKYDFEVVTTARDGHWISRVVKSTYQEALVAVGEALKATPGSVSVTRPVRRA